MWLMSPCPPVPRQVYIIRHEASGAFVPENPIDVSNLGCNAVRSVLGLCLLAQTRQTRRPLSAFVGTTILTRDLLLELVCDSWAPAVPGSDVMRLVTGSCDNNVTVWEKSSASVSTRAAWTSQSCCAVFCWLTDFGCRSLVTCGSRSGWASRSRYANCGHRVLLNRPRSPRLTCHAAMAPDVLVQDGHSDWVRDVAWAPATGVPYNMIASAGEDGRVIVWVEVRGPCSD